MRRDRERKGISKVIHKENFGPGDKLVRTSFDSQDVIAQAFITTNGKKILLINQRKKEVMIKLPPGIKGGKVAIVDVSTVNGAGMMQVTNNKITLKPFAVGVITLK